ncbi:hypothetical protein Tco_1479238 [Tanacetum coccineum]
MAIPQRPINCCFSRSYKAVKVRYIRFMIQPELEGSTQEHSINRVEVLGMIEKRSKVRMGIMPNETELAREQSQQGVSYEVSSALRRSGISDCVTTSFQLSQDSRPHVHDPSIKINS